jgi:hypothetical protein
MKKAMNPDSDQETLLNYAGNVSSAAIDHLLEMAENKLNQQITTETTKKKVFRVMVEAIQNVYHHLDRPNPDMFNASVNFRLLRDNLAYTVIAGNPVKNSKIGELKSFIDKLNAMSLSELTDYYRTQLGQGLISTDGGAGLGFADIIRKSGKKISYSFKPVNKDYSYFSLRVKVSA